MSEMTPLDEWQSAQEYWSLLASGVYRGDGCPAGDGRSVIVIPGLFGNDLYLTPMRQWLARIGYRPAASELLWNAGCPNRLLAEVSRPLRRVLDDTAADVAIIGHSRGGMLGKALASRFVDRVSHLILIGSPLGGMLRAGRAGMQAYANDMAHSPSPLRQFAFNAGRGVMRALDPDCDSPLCDCDYMDQMFAPLPESVKVTSILSPTDPIVPPLLSAMPYGQNFQVQGTHSGLMFNAEVFPLVAQALAE